MSEGLAAPTSEQPEEPQSEALWNGQARQEGEEDDDRVDERVTIFLDSGEDLCAKPYGHSVSGHHVMLQRTDGTIWKATRSHREERFYVTMRACVTTADGNGVEADASLVEGNEHHFLGHCMPSNATMRSAISLAEFVPKFYGMQQVRKLRCAHDQSTPSSTAGETHNSDFPKSPELVANFDAALPHTAEELVATFQRAVLLDSAPSESQDCCAYAVERRGSVSEGDEPTPLIGAQHHLANVALRRSTLLPSKAPLSGRPLDHHLPRTEDQLVNMIVLEDICKGMRHPCVLDIKMGTRQYGVGAPEKKKLSKSEKARQSTSSTLGLRLSGYKRYDPRSGIYEAKGKRECFRYTPAQLEDSLLSFVAGDASLADAFCTLCRRFETAFASQTAFRFFTSSILLAYDALRPVETAKLRMVDFAYTYTKEELEEAKDEDAAMEHDEGYRLGIESLVHMLEQVVVRSLQLHPVCRK